MAAPRHEPDRVEDHVVGKNRAHVVGMRVDPPHRRVDIETDALLAAALVRIGADVGRRDEVADEDDVEGVVAGVRAASSRALPLSRHRAE